MLHFHEFFLRHAHHVIRNSLACVQAAFSNAFVVGNKGCRTLLCDGAFAAFLPAPNVCRIRRILIRAVPVAVNASERVRLADVLILFSTLLRVALYALVVVSHTRIAVYSLYMVVVLSGRGLYLVAPCSGRVPS